jgi:hypothetical protein
VTYYDHRCSDLTADISEGQKFGFDTVTYGQRASRLCYNRTRRNRWIFL